MGRCLVQSLAATFVFASLSSFGLVQAARLEPSQSKKLWQAIRATPSLATACVLRGDVSAGKVELEILVDSAKDAEQSAAIVRLSAKTLGMETTVRQTHRMPLTDLLQRLNQQISTLPKLKGCYLRSLFYDPRTPDGDTVDLIIDGHFIDKDQLDRLAKSCDEFLGHTSSGNSPLSPPRILFLVDSDAAFLASNDQIKAVEELRQQQIEDDRLHGTWVDVRDLFDRIGNRVLPCATLIVDSAKADAQADRLNELLTQRVDRNCRILKTIQVPLSGILRQLGRDLSAPDEFVRQSRWLAGAFFDRMAESPEKEGQAPVKRLQVILYGPFFPSTRADRVVQKCADLISKDPAWKTTAEYTFTPVDIMLRPPAAAQGAGLARVAEMQMTVRSGICSDSRLHGAWLEILPFDYGGRIRHYDVILWLDADRAAQQRPGVEALLRRHLDADYRICEEVRLPLAALASRLQDALATKAIVGYGSWIGGARYDVDSAKTDRIQIVFNGRLIPASYEPRVREACQKLIDADRAFRELGPRELWPEARPLLVYPEAKDFAGVASGLTRLREVLQAHVRREPLLHGAWIEVAPCLDQAGQLEHYDAHLWLARDTAAEQRAKVEEILKNSGRSFKIVQETRLPFQQLVDDVKKRLSGEFGPGCYVSGAYFQADATPGGRETSAADTIFPSYGLQLVLVGRVWNAGMKNRVQEECKGLMDQDTAWAISSPHALTSRPRQPTVIDRDLILQPLSPRATQLLADIRKKTETDPQLHGVWLDLGECRNQDQQLDHYDVYLWLDRDKAADQKSHMETLLKAYRTPLKIVQETQLPFSELVSSLKQRIEEIYGWGRYISGAFYEAQVDKNNGEITGVALTLFGRVWTDAMKTRILSECKLLMDRDPVWQQSAPGLAASSTRRLEAIDRGLLVHALHEDSRNALKEIRAELVRNVRLHGAWVDLAECYDHLGNTDHYEVCVWTDPAAMRNDPTTAESVDTQAVRSSAPAAQIATNQAASSLPISVNFPYVRRPCGCVPVMGIGPALNRSSSSTHGIPGVPQNREPRPIGDVATRQASTSARPHAAAFDQREAVSNLLDRWLGKGRYTILLQGDAPLTNLLQSARTEIAEAIGPGCHLSGAYFEPEDNSKADSGLASNVQLVVYGHVFNDAQKTVVLDKVVESQRRDPAWRRLPRLGPKPVVATRVGQQWSTANVTIIDRGLASPKRSDRLTRTLRQIHDTLRDDRLLHGAWVDIAECYDPYMKVDHYDVYLWLDSGSSPREAGTSPTETALARPAAQRAEILRQLDRALGEGNYTVVDEVHLPVSGLLNAVRMRAAEDFGSGCFVRGGYFRDAEEGESSTVEFTIYGRVFENGQRARILDNVRELLRADHSFNRLPGTRQCKIVVGDRDLVIFQPSPQLLELRDQVRTAIAADPRLDGAWVDLADCPDYRGQTDHYDVYLWLDDGLETSSVTVPASRPVVQPAVWIDRCGCLHHPIVAQASSATAPDSVPSDRSSRPIGADVQRILVQRILDRHLGHDRYAIIEEVKVPFSRLAAQLRNRIEAIYGPGNFLSGLRYLQVKQQGQGKPLVKLQLDGRVLDDSQRTRITDECRLLVDADPTWRRLPGPGGCRLIVDDQFDADVLSEQGREKLASIRKFLFSDPQLHGTWVDIAECKNLRRELDSFDVCLWVDSDKAATQKQAVLPLLNQWLGVGKYSIVKESALPLSRTVAKLQQTVSSDNPATFVCGAYYTQPHSPTGPVEIALYGGARDKNAQTLVLTAFSMLQQSDPGWANPATLRGNKLVAVDHELRPWTLSADTQKKLAKIHQTVLDSNELRGAWVELAECRDHTGQFLCYNIHVHYDIDAPTDAKDKLKAILGADLGQPYVIAREEPLPLSDLASRINSILGLKESMDGCVIQGCCFFPLPSDGMTVPRAQMIVFGRIADEEQRAALTKTVKTIVEYDPDLQTHLANFDIRTDGLQVVPPNSLRGERQFNLGLRHFWNNDYAEAAKAFLQASAETPNAIEYRYWQAVSELKQGRSDRAYRVMQGVVARQPNPNSENSRRLYMSLQRIQGDIRSALVTLESRARSERTLIARDEGISRP